MEEWTSEYMESGAVEQSWFLPSCLRSVCLCGVCGRLREQAPGELYLLLIALLHPSGAN